MPDHSIETADLPDGQMIEGEAPALLTREHFGRYVRAQWAKNGEKLTLDGRVGIDIGELVALSVERNSKVDAPHIDLWIAILDEFNSWLVSLFSIVYQPAKNNSSRLNDFERSIVVLLGKLIVDTTALRHLVEFGFDGSARTLLRSISEYLHVLVALIDDPTLGAEFVAADTPATANAFYFRQLALGKLHKRLEAAWASFFRSDDSAARWFADQRRQQGTLLSGTAHPSFAGGTQAVMGFIEAEPSENWLGQWGAKSNISVATIALYADSFLPLVLLCDFPFEGFDDALSRPIHYDASNELHRHVKIGRSVLASLILSLAKESNLPHVYPPGLEPLNSIDDEESDGRSDAGTLIKAIP